MDANGNSIGDAKAGQTIFEEGAPAEPSIPEVIASSSLDEESRTLVAEHLGRIEDSSYARDIVPGARAGAAA